MSRDEDLSARRVLAARIAAYNRRCAQSAPRCPIHSRADHRFGPSPRLDDPVRHHDRLVRVPAVPRAADHREADPAVVRRHGGGLDGLRRVLPGRAARRLCVRARADAPLAAHAGDAARRAARREPREPADHRVVRVEARPDVDPDVAHRRPARRDDRPAVLPAVVDRPARPEVVRGGRARRSSRGRRVPPVRAVEPRVARRPAALPVRRRAVREPRRDRRGAGARATLCFAIALRGRARGACASRDGRRRSAPAARPTPTRAARRRSRATCSGSRARRSARCCCSRSRTTSRRTSRRSRSCGSCR